MAARTARPNPRILAAALIAALFFPAFVGGTVSADSARVERIKAAFTAWAARSGVTGGALAIVADGRIAGSIGVGTVQASDPEPIASNSKAITGICIVKLVEAGKLGFGDTIGKLLPDFFTGDPRPNAPAKKITVAALLTHTSGFGIDPTQGAPLLQFAPFSHAAAAEELTAALAVPLTQPAYGYNNVNYAALGLIVTAVTGRSYEDYCRRSVLEPVGITDAALNPDWMVMGAFGGWKLSAEDYARFLSYFDPRSGLLMIKPKDWPKTSVGNGGFYSVGTLMRDTDAGFNFWHFGSWVWTGTPKASFGAYFARWSTGIGVAANYQPTVSDAAMGDLDQSLYKAAQ